MSSRLACGIGATHCLLFLPTTLRERRRIDLLLLIDSLAKDEPALRRDSMLDGKNYFAEFPDEDPENERPPLLHSPTLMATLRALEKELRPYIPKPMETEAEADDPST